MKRRGLRAGAGWLTGLILWAVGYITAGPWMWAGFAGALISTWYACRLGMAWQAAEQDDRATRMADAGMTRCPTCRRPTGAIRALTDERHD